MPEKYNNWKYDKFILKVLEIKQRNIYYLDLNVAGKKVYKEFEVVCGQCIESTSA
jgi:hypothetical protein